MKVEMNLFYRAEMAVSNRRLFRILCCGYCAYLDDHAEKVDFGPEI